MFLYKLAASALYRHDIFFLLLFFLYTPPDDLHHQIMLQTRKVGNILGN